MNFFVNKAMGIGNSGVEHAQFYRAKCFEMVGIPYKYIFVELIKNLYEAKEAWNIPNDKVINMWEFFVFGDEYLIYGAKKKFELKESTLIDYTNTHRIKETVTSSGMRIIEHLEKSPNKKNMEMLLVSPYKVEIFDCETSKRKIMYEYTECKNIGRLIKNIHLFDFNGQHLFFRTEVLLQRFFFHYIAKKFEGKNVFLLDRGQQSESALFNHTPSDTSIIEIIHADHLSDRDIPSNPLWNNYYEYLLTHLEMVEKVVVATTLQKKDLLRDFPEQESKILAIPVGGIRDQVSLENNNSEYLNKKIKKFITVSRLASEKHIDIVIKAICEARKQFPEITLDIYGQGGEKNNLQLLIKESNAEAFINLKGHSNEIDTIYPKYDAFISGSYSEGFGLTYIEALNAGLPIVTFKARFGALELVKEGVNGFLKDYSRKNEQYSINQLKEGVVQLLQANTQMILSNTKKSVINYQDSIIAEQWKDLINGL